MTAESPRPRSSRPRAFGPARSPSPGAGVVLALLLAGCVTAPPPIALSSRTGVVAPPPRASDHPRAQCGLASWYAMTSRTASGERADPSAMTAAHRSLPFGTRVHVTNLDNGQSAVVRINDRGPFVPGRVIDVSKAAAERLGFVSNGTAHVRLRANAASNQGLAAARCP